MTRRIVSFVSIALLVVALAPAAAAAQDDEQIQIGFLPGVIDPFYQVMELGVNAAIADAGLADPITQVPDQWGPTIQTPILDALVARGDIDCLITAPTDKEQMITPLQFAVDAGISVVTVDTFLGDGDYVNGEVTFPISYIGSDNVEGGRIAARALADSLGGEGTAYIQNTNEGVSTTEQRSEGFRAGIAEFPGIEIVGEDYNLDDENTAVTQTSAKLLVEPDLGGIFGVNVFSAQGAGNAVINAGLGGVVDVIAFDATIRAIELMDEGVVSLIIAQKPFDMGYMGVQACLADAGGVTSYPTRITTGYAVITPDNVTDPEVARFIYRVE
ncbi:MAG: ABC transporter substrate-binding protein [Chloroflexota bacterium]